MNKAKATKASKQEPPIDPDETYGITYPYHHKIELVEKAFAGLPMRVPSRIQFHEFEKLTEYPPGYIRYNVKDSIDTYKGCAIIEMHSEDVTTVRFIYQRRYDDLFKDIKAELDKFLAVDAETAALVRGKGKLIQTEKPGQAETSKLDSDSEPYVPTQTKRLNDWKAIWRKIKARWKGGAHYDVLLPMAKCSLSTLTKVIKAGEAGKLD